MARSVTLKDVARKVGVSFQTVSLVINNSHGVAEATRDRVRQAIKELNYTPNGIARGLRKKQSRRIAFVVPSVVDPYTSELITTIEGAARANGYTVTLLISNYSPEQELANVAILRSERVDGAIIVMVGEDHKHLVSLAKEGIAVVLLDPATIASREALPSVEIDNIGATFSATECLIKLGHRRIAYLTEPLTWQNLRDRLEGYRQGIQEYELPIAPELIYVSPDLRTHPAMAGYAAVGDLISLKDPPTAIIALSDITALGVIKAVRDNGLNVPADISVIGFDDLTFSSFIDPPLTSVRQPKGQIGRLAVELLLKMRAGEQLSSQRIVLNTELIIRRSTGPAPR